MRDRLDGLLAELEHKKLADGEVSTHCPFCGKMWHLHLRIEDDGPKHTRGVWNCKKCGERGRTIGRLIRQYEAMDRAAVRDVGPGGDTVEGTGRTGSSSGGASGHTSVGDMGNGSLHMERPEIRGEKTNHITRPGVLPGQSTLTKLHISSASADRTRVEQGVGQFASGVCDDRSALRSFCDTCRDSLAKRPDHLKYLRRRGITTNGGADLSGMGVATGDQLTEFWKQAGHDPGRGPNREETWLVIPYTVDGKVVNAKLRRLPPHKKAFLKLVPGAELPLYNIDALKPGSKYVHVTEGELDAIVLSGLVGEPVVSLPNGAQSFGESEYDALSPMSRLYLWLDPDEAGRKGGQRLAARLGQDRCYWVPLPDGQDVSDYVQSTGPEAMPILVGQSAPMGEPAIYSLVRTVDRPDFTKDDFPLPFARLRRLVGPVQRGKLLQVFGLVGSGKTTFCLQYFHELAWIHHHKCLLIELELEDYEVRDKIVACHKSHLLQGVKTRQALVESCDISQLTEADRLRWRADMVRCGGRLYIASLPERMEPSAILEIMEEGVRRYGVDAIMLDHIHFLCRGEDSGIEIETVTRDLKLFARRYSVLVNYVSHPRKVAEGHAPGLQDVKYSGSGDCDYSISLYRSPISNFVGEGSDAKERDEAMSPRTLVSVVKTRASSGGRMKVWYEGRMARFMEMEDDEATGKQAEG